MANKPTYDVAISFLVADEQLGAAIRDGLTGLNVFFFPHKQEELVGTNGLESMRQPFLDARVLVVLYREQWGKTPWTGVELQAITDRCLREKFRPLVFVQLQKNDPLPDWLPDTHIRCSLEQYGIEQLVGAIKIRVQECGGEIYPPDAMSEAKRIKSEAEFITDREAMMGDRRWIEGTVHQSLRETMQEIVRLVDEANQTYGFQIVRGAQDRSCVLRSGFVSMAVGWHQPIYNRVSDQQSDKCYLRVAEFSGSIMLPGEQGWYMHEPRLLKEHRFKVDVSLSRDMVWVENGKNKQVQSGKLADRIVQLFLDLVSRANRGKVERPRL